MVVGHPAWRRYVPAIIFGIAALLLLLGFARPEAKFREAKEGATIVLMIDNSGSMGANDVKPTRLLAADAAVTEFLKKLPSRYRVALITFSSSIAAKVPPTYDRNAVIRALPRVAELQGTAMGVALKQAVLVAEKAVGPSKPGHPHPPATILMISDGGSNSGDVTPTAAAALARKAKIPVSTVAIGTTAGIVHQIVPIGKGQTVPFQQQVPVQPATLKSVARTSGGKFFAAHSATELTAVYKELGSRLVYSKQYREITVAVTAAALVLILAGAALSAWWFRRLV
jgi:Ca-activated chloride channel family protein